MRYFVEFYNGKVRTSWEREDENDHPSYIKKEDIVEISQEQYEKSHFLQLIDGEPIIVYPDNYYKRQRRKEYGPVADQLDEMYWDFAAWQARIEAIKNKYPKPE